MLCESLNIYLESNQILNFILVNVLICLLQKHLNKYNLSNDNKLIFIYTITGSVYIKPSW